MALTVCPSPYARTLRNPPASLTYAGGEPAAELAGPPATRPARVAPATATMTTRAGLRTRGPPMTSFAVAVLCVPPGEVFAVARCRSCLVRRGYGLPVILPVLLGIVG